MHIPAEGLGVRKTTKVFSSRDAADDWLRANTVRIHAEALLLTYKPRLAADTRERAQTRALRDRTRKLFEARIQRELDAQALCFTIVPPQEPGEEWRWIPGQRGKYRISSHGRVWSQPRVRATKTGMLKPYIGRKGYRQITFGPRSSKPKLVYRLVLTVFDRPKPPGLVGRHLNGDPADDRIQNLRWGTPRENVLDMLWHKHCRVNNLPKEQYVRPTTATNDD